jgi:hypothetical protein
VSDAVAVRAQRPVRDVEAIAERPDGSRFHFIPYPTPLFSADGGFAGAVNLLREVAEQRSLGRLRSRPHAAAGSPARSTISRPRQCSR